MNLKEIRDLIDLMNENDLTEIEIERKGSKIKLKKSALEVAEMVQRVPVGQSIQMPLQPPVPAQNDTVKAEALHLKEIQSPMVGTFYRASSPDSSPFVEVGQRVEVGEVVCIVEAMKLMNEIKSEVNGKIVEAPVENAQPVEFGQVLFTVEPLLH